MGEIYHIGGGELQVVITSLQMTKACPVHNGTLYNRVKTWIIEMIMEICGSL